MTRPWGAANGGQILPLFALLLPLLLLPVAALAVDGGLLMAQHANLQGEAELAAEAGSQAVDVIGLQQSSNLGLCVAPDGGPTCGNGVGTVAQAISLAAQVGGGAACDPGLSPSARPSGCGYRVLYGCPAGTNSVADGVTVVVWRRLQLPLLAFLGLGSVVISAQATSRLERGYAAPQGPAPPCR